MKTTRKSQPQLRNASEIGIPRIKVRLLTAGMVSVFLASGCKTPPTKPVAAPDPDAKPVSLQSQGPIRMPSGVDPGRVLKLDKGEMQKVFLQQLRIDDSPANRLLFPRQMATAMDMTQMQLTRLFTDTILQSRRFEVFDIRSTVTAEQSDYVIDAQIVSASQDVRSIEGGLRVLETRVNLSVQMRNVYSGDFVFPTAVAVEGITGMTTGDRALLQPRETAGAPEVQQRAAADYLRALNRAYRLAAQRIEEVLRPMGKVLSVEGRSIGILGGQRHGLIGNDRLVVFRGTLTKVGNTDVFASVRPIAVVQCEGVGTVTSQCEIVRLENNGQVQVGDYAVLTDDSLKKDRWL
jgi:hypothetical protein